MADTNTIGRTITISTVYYTRDGKGRPRYKDLLYGKHDRDTAQRRLRRMFKDQTIVVVDIKHTRKHYVMSTANFMANAHVTREYKD